MNQDIELDELRVAIKRECILKRHSDVMEITFKRKEDAEWFENIFEYLQRESAVCCLMPIRPKNAPPKFIFNVKDIYKLINLISK